MSKIKYSLIIKIVVLLAMICVALPFVSVSCDTNTLDTYTGINLVTGVDLKEELAEVELIYDKKIPSITLITLALFMGIITFVCSFFKNKVGYIFATISSGIGLLSVVLSIIAMETGLDKQIQYLVDKKHFTDVTQGPKITFEYGIYLMIALFALTFVTCILACVFRKEFKIQLLLVNKRAVAGYIFIIPFIVGFLFFFLKPVIQSINFSFNRTDIVPTGYTLTYSGLEYYKRALLIDPEFNQILVGAIQKLLLDLPLIVIFSFFAATLLNSSFKGRGFVRAVFFMPVILTSGVIIGVEISDILLTATKGSFQKEVTSNPSTVMKAFELQNLLQSLNMPATFIGYITGAVERLYSIVISSGVQIMVFLAALQSIPSSLYEASSIEGATSWEDFWKITLPMVSPYIVVCTVYTIIDSFTAVTNTVMTKINETAFRQLNYSFSSAMAWLYFLAIFGIMAVIIGIISRFVFYYDV